MPLLGTLTCYNKNINNYKELCEANSLDYNKIIKARQAHTDKIYNVDGFGNNNILDTLEPCDGIITNKKNIVLATTNADCILLLFFDPVKKVIANIHSGWRGTLQQISVKTINEMQKKYRKSIKKTQKIVLFQNNVILLH